MLATEPLNSSLYSGFTGIAWAVETVDHHMLGTEGEDRNGDIDEALTSLLRQYPVHAPYDLIHGLAGIGVYALARWPRPAAVQCILGVVEQLARRARHDGDGVYWWTPPSWNGPRQDAGRPGGVDLGVAHGMAGVIPFLARVHRLGLAQQTARRCSTEPCAGCWPTWSIRRPALPYRRSWPMGSSRDRPALPGVTATPG